MKKEKFKLLVLTTVLAMSAVPIASAADLNTTSKGIINFDALDTDHDGRLTQTEFDANTNFKGQKFDDLDKNDDGNVDSVELSTWARVHGKGNAVGSNNTTGIIGTTGTIGVPSVGVPSVAPNVNATVNGSVNRTGAGATIGTKANRDGSTRSDVTTETNTGTSTDYKAGSSVSR